MLTSCPDEASLNAHGGRSSITLCWCYFNFFNDHNLLNFQPIFKRFGLLSTSEMSLCHGILINILFLIYNRSMQWHNDISDVDNKPNRLTI